MIPRTAFSLLALAAIALAQNQAQRPTVALKYELDGEHVSITVDGDEIQVDIDGKRNDDRVKRHDDSVEICDRDGVPVAVAHRDNRGVQLQFLEQARAAWLGVDLTSVEEALANHLGLDREKVALVTGVAEGSPAAQAGLRQHDILIRFDGQEPATLERLREILAAKHPGDALRISLLRRGESQEVEARLQRAKAGEGTAQTWPLFQTYWDRSGAHWQLYPTTNQQFRFLEPVKWEAFKDSHMRLNQLYPDVVSPNGTRWKYQADKPEKAEKADKADKDEPADQQSGDRLREQIDELRKQIGDLQEMLRKMAAQPRKD